MTIADTEPFRAFHPLDYDLVNSAPISRRMEPSMPTQNATRFSWSELPTDAPMALLERKRIIGKQAMISHIHLHKGCSVPTHEHANEQFACVLSGSIRFGIGKEGSSDRRDIIVSAGEVLHLPAMVPHSADALEDTIVLDIFSPPSETTGIDRGR